MSKHARDHRRFERHRRRDRASQPSPTDGTVALGARSLDKLEALAD
jgi:hypothetical protein